jgi:hypothetical protein
MAQQPAASVEPVINPNPLELAAALPDPAPTTNSSLIKNASLVAPSDLITGKQPNMSAPIINIYVNTASSKEFLPEVNTIDNKVAVRSIGATTKVEKYNF